MPTGSQKPVQLAELAALNDEIISLVRAKIPLQRGLRTMAGDGGGRMFELANQLADSMNQGQSLEQAIADQGNRIPAAYATVVKAGVRSGRLTSALEAVSNFAWDQIDLRRHVARAMLYPLILLSVAYMLFILFISQMLTEIAATYRQLQLPTSKWFDGLLWTANTCRTFWWIPPLLLAILIMLWIGSRRATTLNFSGIFSPLRWIPGVSAIGRSYTHYSFAHMMSLLCEQGVPLDESLEMAADTSGSQALRSAAYQMAELDRQGQTADLAKQRHKGFPPFLQWIISRRQKQTDLVRSLKMSADVYKRRGATQVLWLKYSFPMIASLVIGGAVTLVYTLSLFVPLSELLTKFANEF